MYIPFTNREILSGAPPTVVKATASYAEDQRLQLEPGDVIALIDDRAELNFVKGQNQRTFEIGTFPR